MKEKLESMKILKENKIYLKLLRLYVPHLLQEYQHNEYICENLKQEHWGFHHTFGIHSYKPCNDA